jgi:hypothetical protein
VRRRLIRELEALRVGPDDVLVLRWRHPLGDDPDGLRRSVAEAAEQVGLAGRVLLLEGDEFDLIVAMASEANPGGLELRPIRDRP